MYRNNSKVEVLMYSQLALINNLERTNVPFPPRDDMYTGYLT